MTYLVTLRDTRNGHEAVYKDNWTWEHVMDDVAYVWNEGNNSCDCNRSRFVYPDDESKWLDCSDGVIELVKIEAKP